MDLRFAGGKGWLALIGAAWLSAIVGDLVFYGYHRLAHTVLFLWQLHKLHHMDPELDALTVNRDNWLDAVYAAITLGIPASILDIFFKFDDLIHGSSVCSMALS